MNVEVESLNMTDEQIMAAATKIRTEGRPNQFSAGHSDPEWCGNVPTPEWCMAVLTKADDIEKANESAIGKGKASK